MMQQYNLFEVIEQSSHLPLVSPSQFSLHVIDVKLACELVRLWHSSHPDIHWSNVVRNKYYVCFGARYSSRWYAVAIWSSPISRHLYNKGILELRRYAICDEAPKNTASHLLSRMIKLIKKKFPEIKKLISYQDVSVHRGTIYMASNWKVGGYVKGTPWNHKSRKRNEFRTSNKIRWEYNLEVKVGRVT